MSPKGEQATDANPDLTTEQHQAYVETRVSELLELGTKDDPTSLETILGELTNRDPEIRKAAVEASMQFGSRDAIPKLMDAAAQTDDPHEKAEILEAIEFLKLPSLSETLAQAGGQTPRARSPRTNPSTKPPSSQKLPTP